MQLSDRTTQVLKNFSQINPSILVRRGNVLSTMAPSKKIIGRVQVDESFENEFAIFDLSRFLSALSFFDKPELNFSDKFVTIGDGSRKLRYTFASPETVLAPPAAGLQFPGPDAATQVSFALSAKVLGEVTKAAHALSLPEIAVTGDGSTVQIQAIDHKNTTAHVYSSTVGETTETFRMIFRLEAFKLLPGDYDAVISFRRIAQFTSGPVCYWIVAEDASTIG
jgi:hypothetical protein